MNNRPRSSRAAYQKPAAAISTGWGLVFCSEQHPQHRRDLSRRSQASRCRVYVGPHTRVLVAGGSGAEPAIPG